MAWIVETKLTSTCSVRTEVEPHELILLRRHDDYVASRPEIAIRHDAYRSGSILPPTLFPNRAVVGSRTKKLPDIVSMFNLAVSERFKGLLEHLEPGRHQFVEVPIFFKNGTPYPERYHCVVLGNVAFDQVDDRSTTMRRTPAGKIEPPDSTGRRGIIAINRRESSRWHAWFSADIYHKLTISDELYWLIKEAGIPCLSVTRLVEVEP